MTDETLQIERPVIGTIKASTGLPKGIVEVAPDVTTTEPTEGLDFHRDPGGYRYYLRVYGYSTGGFGLDVAHSEDPAQGTISHLDRLGRGPLVDRIHVMAAARHDGGDFNPWSLQVSLTWDRNPWRTEEFWNKHWLRWIEHVPAPSDRVPGNLSYYQSPAKRAANIRTPIKPGRYLRKYFGDILSEEDIQRLGIAWQAAFTAPELHVTQDADEIERVYRGRYNGSCMHFGGGGWQGECHPARVYAGPDLGIAYIGDVQSADARCLVWPEKKIYYPKFYGDHIRLALALKQGGWTEGREDDFDGARIRRFYDADRDLFTVPYCDTHTAASDTGRYLILDEGGYICLRETNGTSVDDPDRNSRVTCDECDDRVDEDYITYVESTDRHVCRHCRSLNYTRCDLTDEYHRDEDFVDAVGVWDISQEAVDRGLAFLCEGSELYHPNSAGQVEMASGETWSEPHFATHGGVCAYDGGNYPKDELEDIGDGRMVASDNLDEARADNLFMTQRGRDEHPDQLSFDDKLELTADDFQLAPEPAGWDAVKAQFVATYGPDAYAHDPRLAKEQALVLMRQIGVPHLQVCAETPHIIPSLRLACTGLLKAIGKAPAEVPFLLAA